MDHVMNDCWPTPAGAGPGLIGATSVAARGRGGEPLGPVTELISGLCKIEQTAFTAHTCTAIVTRGHRLSGAGGGRLSSRDIEILERALLEGVRKSVAIDFGLCPSSIAENLEALLRVHGAVVLAVAHSLLVGHGGSRQARA